MNRRLSVLDREAGPQSADWGPVVCLSPLCRPDPWTGSARPKDDEAMPATPAHRFSKFLTIDQVAKILNVNKPTIYALLRSGEMKGLHLGGRGVWRISEDDLQALLDTAYEAIAERMPAGDVGEVPGADGESSP